MKRWTWFALGAVICFAGAEVRGQGLVLRGELDRVNRSIQGQVLDFTHNHGKDNRIWSAALGEKRDLYVYLPPGFNPAKKYPLGIFLHGAGMDERLFLKSLVRAFDASIVDGTMPPVIVAAPDGSLRGRPSLYHLATFFANTDAGRYEDYLMEDVWDFLMKNFPIHPERDAHALIGASMGGSAAFAQAIKHRDKVKVAIGFLPVLNLRWVDCHGRYAGKFDPNCWGWREQVRPFEVIGRPKGVFAIRFHHLFGPLIGHGPDAMAKLSRFNPIELMDQYDLRPGELDLYIAYGGKDEFNVPAQVESFLYRARERGLTIGISYDPRGRHDEESARRLFPDAMRWVAPLVAPYVTARTTNVPAQNVSRPR